MPTKVIRLPSSVIGLARSLANGQLRAGDIQSFLDFEARTQASIPLGASHASCGFPSPADDYLDSPLDFNELLIQNPAATFAVRLASDSMTGAGLFPGDIAIVDRSIEPVNGCIVVALLDGEFTVSATIGRLKASRSGLKIQPLPISKLATTRHLKSGALS